MITILNPIKIPSNRKRFYDALITKTIVHVIRFVFITIHIESRIAFTTVFFFIQHMVRGHHMTV